MLRLRPHLAAAALLVGLIALSGCTQQQQAEPERKQASYSFWPAAPDAPRVQFLKAYNTSQDVSGAGSKFDEMLYGKTAGVTIIKPYGIAVWNSRVYVTDLKSRGVVVLDLRKNETRIMGAGGRADIQRAVSVRIAPDGTKYVIDATKNSIVIFTPDERYAGTISMPDFNPVDLAIYKNELYVSDFTGAVVKVIDATSGVLLRTIGKPGPNDGEFVRPLGIMIDNDGNVIVADVFKCRIQKFTRQGELLVAFGEPGNRAGDFVRPKHLAMDSSGMLYVVDAAFNNVQVFDPEGKVVGFFGLRGSHAGAMDLPAGIAVVESDLDLFQAQVHPAFDAKRLIVVANQFGPAKVSVYAAGQLKAGKTVADIAAGRTVIKSEGESTATTGPITIGTALPPEVVSPSPATMPVSPGRE